MYNEIATRFASKPDSLRDIICRKEGRGGENSVMNALKFTTTYREVSIYITLTSFLRMTPQVS